MKWSYYDFHLLTKYAHTAGSLSAFQLADHLFRDWRPDLPAATTSFNIHHGQKLRYKKNLRVFLSYPNLADFFFNIEKKHL